MGKCSKGHGAHANITAVFRKTSVFSACETSDTLYDIHTHHGLFRPRIHVAEPLKICFFSPAKIRVPRCSDLLRRMGSIATRKVIDTKFIVIFLNILLKFHANGTFLVQVARD